MTRSSLGPSLKIKVDTLAAILVTLTPLVYFNAALLGKISLASEDGILFNVPLRVAAANIVRGGSLPLWNPYLFSGMPLHAAAQGGLLFPLNWFYLLFDAPTATNLMALSTYMLAALGANLFARRSGSSPAGAVVTSLVWQACGFMIGQFSHVNIVQTAALLPWLLWAVDGYGVRGERRWALIIAVIVMLQAFAGHQQTLVYSLLLATAYALVMWRALGPARNWYLRSLLLLGAGMLLAAVQILPTYELMRNSLRSRASFDFFTAFSLPPKFLFTFFAPYLMGGGDGRLFRVTYFGAPFYGEFIAYVGLGALMLAVFAVVLKRDARTKFWTAVVVIAFVLALGRHWPFKLYAIIYYIPVLNLFRVPARHMMELDLALAMLAGRGLTALAALTDRKRTTRLALIVGGAVAVTILLVVTIGRPAAFQVPRAMTVTLLRAPELFLPVFFALLSAAALYWYAHSRRAMALSVFVAVLILDLWLWGHSSGWRIASPPPDSPVWSELPPVKLLPRADEGQYRILTAPHRFDPNQQVVGPMTSRSTDWVLWLQPNLYMMHGIENAAGYDGFGMARYSRLAGDMAVWGELPNPDQTLRGPGRELDLLNVKYLLAMSSLESQEESSSSFSPRQAPSSSERTSPLVGVSAAKPSPSTEVRMVTPEMGSSILPLGITVIISDLFADKDLNVPSINKSSSLVFEPPPVPADRIALLTNLSWSADLPDGTPVARLHLRAEDGRTFEFDLKAGEHTAEWSYDRPDIRRRIKHSRARVGTSFKVSDAQARYQGHTYLCAFMLPERATITFGEIKVVDAQAAPDLTLTVHRISLSDGQSVLPMEPAWITRRANNEKGGSARWERVGDTDLVTVFENTRVLPRAWLVSSFEVLNEKDILQTIRTGSLPNENVWDPRRTVLLEAPVELDDAASSGSSGDVPKEGSATVLEHQPNRVQLRTASAASSILVLSENFYPGWRAYVDGRSVEILRVNYNQRGVVLAPGEHTVEFVYRPWSILIGIMISMLTLLALGAWCLKARRRVASH